MRETFRGHLTSRIFSGSVRDVRPMNTWCPFASPPIAQLVYLLAFFIFQPSRAGPFAKKTELASKTSLACLVGGFLAVEVDPPLR
jgi:hypothetical protein